MRPTLAGLKAAYLDDLREREVQRQSVRKAERLFDDFLPGIGISSLARLDTDDVIDPFERSLIERGFAPKSRTSWHKELHKLRSFGNEHGFLKHHPRPVSDPSSRGWIQNQKHGQPALGDCLTDSENVRLIRDLGKELDTIVGGRDYLVYELAASHGVNPTASLRLTINDVGPDCGTIAASRGRRPIAISLASHLKQFLRRWLKQPRVQETGLLFPGIKRGRWTYHSWYADRPGMRLKARCKRLGMRPVTFQMVLRRYAMKHEVSPVGFEPEASGGIPEYASDRVVILPSLMVRIAEIEFGPLNPVPHKVLEALWKAGNRGLTGAELKKQAGAGSAVDRWVDLRNKHEYFRRVLPPPGRGYRGSPARYRLLRRLPLD